MKPVQKKDKYTLLATSYKPININPAVTTVIETHVQNQIINHMNRNQMIPFGHQGVQRHHATTMLVNQLAELWETLREDSVPAIQLIIDQTAVYNIIDHPMLIKKLEVIGLDHDSLAWMMSFLLGRHQTTIVNGCYSTTQPKCVIPGTHT